MTPPRGVEDAAPYSLLSVVGGGSLPARRSSHLDLLILGKIAFRDLA